MGRGWACQVPSTGKCGAWWVSWRIARKAESCTSPAGLRSSHPGVLHPHLFLGSSVRLLGRGKPHEKSPSRPQAGPATSLAGLGVGSGTTAFLPAESREPTLESRVCTISTSPGNTPTAQRDAWKLALYFPFTQGAKEGGGRCEKGRRICSTHLGSEGPWR